MTAGFIVLSIIIGVVLALIGVFVVQLAYEVVTFV